MWAVFFFTALAQNLGVICSYLLLLLDNWILFPEPDFLPLGYLLGDDERILPVSIVVGLMEELCFVKVGVILLNSHPLKSLI